MSLVKVIDKTNLESKSKRTHNQAGYLVLPDCVIARSGILQYSDVVCEDGEAIADGALISVMRPASALKACYKQFANLPLTLEHPDDDAVTPENAKTLTVGCLGSEPRYFEKNGIGYIVCDIVVYDEEAQKSIEDGDFTELSAGYETAFRKKRGVSPIGQPYEAEQFLLSPNHVALVERGRCGSECKVCDSKLQLNNKGEKTMKVKSKKGYYRYFLPVGDSDEVIELSEKQAKEMEEKDPDLDIEELDEEEVEFEDVDVPGVDTEEVESEADEDEDEVEVAEEEAIAEDDEECDDEEETAEEETDEEETDEEDEDLTFEVAFEDGSIGKMDKVAYDHVQRFLEISKQGDRRGDSFAKVLSLTSRASKILGNKFDIATYTRGDSVDVDGIKRDVVRKVMPGVVVRGLRGAALDSLFNSAVRTYSRKKDNYERDIASLCNVEDSIVNRVDSRKQDMVSVARGNFLRRLNKKSK